ncbi:MAG: hypothetical protein M1282_12440 [Chloroflexi bacterium]|nr:hypothetical protein [Chloroflexota bacterium]
MTRPSLIQRTLRKFDKTLSSYFFLDQWVIMMAQGAAYDSLQWSALRPIVPDKDRYWADPFVIQKDNLYYIFAEEKIYATKRGRIICITLDQQGNILSNQVVLERPYHLSYPFVFEYKDEIYMLPESAQSLNIELYRRKKFPNEWQFVKNLIAGIYAADATLFEHNGKWWMFANIKETGGSSLDALHLFYADNPLADHWTPHPRNPVVKDIGSARPAGRIFVQDGKLIRPSQDSSRRYGRALKFNRITKLNKTEYEETLDSTFLPRGGKIIAAHTFNQAGNLTVIDAIIRRWK